MSATGQQVPSTPLVISPTPTASEDGERGDGYFGPVTRSAAKARVPSPPSIDEGEGSESSEELKRARTRSRSPLAGARRRRMSGLTTVKPKKANGTTNKQGLASTSPEKETANGHLSPPIVGSSYWRDWSRSPSPLGLIPIHRHWRSFVRILHQEVLDETLTADAQVHRHEIPRKVFHSSIGFFTIYLATTGLRNIDVTRPLVIAFIPIATADYLRHQYPALNRIYIRYLGALMRETEVDGYNGVLWYLLGTWTVLRWFPRDVGIMGVLLLSWCDTAASTFGRLYGRYTPRIRRGKSLAGSAAAFAVGLCTATFYWGWFVPRIGANGNPEPYMFSGSLSLPTPLQVAFGLSPSQSTVKGGAALAVISIWSGFVGAASEVVDLFNWDDNLTIPVLSGIGLWAFLKVFN
ncbi:MAG: hypothetical protein M1824_006367 [Vezdaea acicularis]|nr:MAG: hypothetical protein M1824_006367 [Vezdaea acicularis]